MKLVVAVRSAAFAVLALLLWPALAEAACARNQVDLRGPFGTVGFAVEVADTPQKRGQGLMFRTSMSDEAGMLFIFDQPGEVAFWMKNTLIPLDMLFIDSRGVVRKIHINAIPGDETAIRSEGDAIMVLEVNGGLTRKLDIRAGAQLRHPALGMNAAWPC